MSKYCTLALAFIRRMQRIVCSLIILLCTPTMMGAEISHNVVLVDVSGSMGGYGWKSIDVFKDAKKQLKTFCATESNVEVVSFASRLYTPLENVEALHIAKGNSNLLLPLAYANSYKKASQGRYNFFFLSDGRHNTSLTLKEVSSLIDSIKRDIDGTKTYYYFVALNNQSRNSDFAKFFNGEHHFFLLDSLGIPIDHSETVAKVSPGKKITSLTATKNSKVDLQWLFWLILILIVALVIYAAYHLFPYLASFLNNSGTAISQTGNETTKYINSIDSKKIMKEEKKQEDQHRDNKEEEKFRKMTMRERMLYIQKLTRHLYGLPDSIREDRMQKLGPEMRKRVEDTRGIMTTGFPKKGGIFEGEPGNSDFVLDDDATVSGHYRPVVKTVREWRSLFNIKHPIVVRYKDGEPDFSKYSFREVKVVYTDDMDYSNLNDLHDQVNEILPNEEWVKKRQRKGTSLDRIPLMRDLIENMDSQGNYKSGCYNVYHEVRNGETVQIVPDFIHKLCKHNGGRSLARIVQIRKDKDIVNTVLNTLK